MLQFSISQADLVGYHVGKNLKHVDRSVLEVLTLPEVEPPNITFVCACTLETPGTLG